MCFVFAGIIGRMKVFTLFIVVAIAGDYNVDAACKGGTEMYNYVQNCMSKMMMFIQAEDSQRKSKCPYLEEGITCIDNMLEDCKDNPAFSEHYTMLKDKMAQSRLDFHSYCNSAITLGNAKLLMFLCLAVSFFWRNLP